MKLLNAHPEARLRILYPNGEAGTLWGRELHDWLVTLGVSSERLQLVPQVSRSDTVTLIVDTKGSQT